MTSRALESLLAGTAALALLIAVPALGQQRPAAPPAVAAPAAPQPPPDPAYEASRAAFEALPEAERRAVQDALMWTGHYSGVTEGNFGARTRAAIIAFQKSVKNVPDGVVDAPEIAKLLAAGKKAREAAKFAVQRDEVTGLRIGVPGALLTAKTAGKAGTRWASADGQATLDTTVLPVSEIDLPALFDRLKSESPTRKVTYKLARPDWIVVSGETAGKRFYSRFARGQDGKGQAVLRGYTVSTPAARADFERVVIAIANSFEPFPGAAATQAVASAPGGTAAPVAPPPPPPVARPVPSATALVVAAGRAVSILPKGCVEPAIGGRAVKIAREDAASGLALLEIAPGAATAAFAPAAAPGAEAELIVVGFVADADPARPLDPPRATLAATAGLAAPGEKGLRVAVGLQPGASGAPAFDRQGRLAGLVGAAGDAPRLVAGVAPLRALPMVGAGEIAAFLGAAGIAPPAATAAPAHASAGEIVARAKPALLAVTCLKQP